MIDDSVLVGIMQRCLQAERSGGAEAVLALFKKALAEGHYVIASQIAIDDKLNQAKIESYTKGVRDAWTTINDALDHLRPEGLVVVPKEATKEMIEAGFVADPLGCDVDEEDKEIVYTSIWHGMIHAVDK